MEKERKKNLILELEKNFRHAKIRAKFDKDKQENGIFINTSKKLNPKYISSEQYFKIGLFYTFLKENEDLTDEEIRNLLKTKLKFSFLLEVDKFVPDFFEELKKHGPMSIAITYIERKYNPTLIK